MTGDGYGFAGMGAWRLYDIEHERTASKSVSNTPNNVC